MPYQGGNVAITKHYRRNSFSIIESLESLRKSKVSSLQRETVMTISTQIFH